MYFQMQFSSKFTHLGWYFGLYRIYSYKMSVVEYIELIYNLKIMSLYMLNTLCMIQCIDKINHKNSKT